MNPVTLPGASFVSAHRDPSTKEAADRSSEEDETSGGGHPRWMMLDPFLRQPRIEEDDSTSGRAAAAVAYACTSTGDGVGVGLKAVAPPLTSRLLLHWRPKLRCTSSSSSPDIHNDDYSRSREGTLVGAVALAAHRNCILVSLPIAMGWKLPLREDLFVYQPASPCARLTRLPNCGHHMINLDTEKNIGLLSRRRRDTTDDEFAVAHLSVTQKGTLRTACPVNAELCVTTGSWRTTNGNVPIRHAASHRMDLIWWRSDAVISLGDSTIGWVDYLRGILFCDDVFSPDPELRYVPLPVNPYPGAEEPGRMLRTEQLICRSVCVTGAAVKFVDAAPWNAWFYGAPDYSRRPAAITAWTLGGEDRSTWTEDGRIDVADFHALAKGQDLPCTRLEFPVVDMNDPRIVHCALRQRSRWFGVEDEVFMVAVDTSSKALVGSPLRYTWRCKAGAVQGDTDCDATCFNLQVCEPFLPCEFSN